MLLLSKSTIMGHVGLPLAIHSRVRDKNLVNNLSEVYIGSDYRRILDLEKRVEQAFLQRKKETGGFFLPDFVKKGQNTFHGTVIVINQRAEDREPVNQPLVIPEKLLSPAPLEFEVKHMEEQIIRNKPVRFAVYHPGKQNSMISKDFTHTWALANYFATDDNRGEIPNNPHVEDEEQHDSEEQQGQSDCENIRNHDNSFFQCKHESLMVGS